MRFDVLEPPRTYMTKLSPDPAVISTHYQKERIVHHFDGNCLLCMSHSRVSYSYCELL